MTTTETTNGNGPHVATAAELRAFKAAPTYLELPESGLTVQVSRAHIADLARTGKIPNRLTGAVMRVLRMPDAPARPDTVEGVVAETSELIEAVACAIMVRPRMAPAPLEGTDVIAPSDLPYADLEWLFSWACRTPGVVPLEGFRPGPSHPVEDVAGGADVPGSPE